VVKEVAKTKKKRTKTSSETITKANVEIDFKTKKIKALSNEQHNLYEKLKGMGKVLH
jgi:hypothetical protein